MQSVLDTFREALRELLHLFLDVLLQVERVRAWHLKYGQHDGRILAKHGGRGILQRAELDAGNVLHPDNRPARWIRAHHDVAELIGVAQAAGCIDLHLERGAFGRRGLPDLAGGDLDILLSDGLLYVDGGDAEFGKLVRIQPDPHRIAPLAEDLNVADAGDAL